MDKWRTRSIKGQAAQDFGLLDARNEETKFLRKIGNHSSKYIVSHSRRPELKYMFSKNSGCNIWFSNLILFRVLLHTFVHAITMMTTEKSTKLRYVILSKENYEWCTDVILIPWLWPCWQRKFVMAVLSVSVVYFLWYCYKSYEYVHRVYSMLVGVNINCYK